MPKKDFALARLQNIIQRLKSVILKDLTAPERQQIKAVLEQLAAAFQADELSFADYKMRTVASLTRYRDQAWIEQFLYRETGTFFTPAEKFYLTEMLAPPAQTPIPKNSQV